MHLQRRRAGVDAVKALLQLVEELEQAAHHAGTVYGRRGFSDNTKREATKAECRLAFAIEDRLRELERAAADCPAVLALLRGDES